MDYELGKEYKIGDVLKVGNKTIKVAEDEDAALCTAGKCVFVEPSCGNCYTFRVCGFGRSDNKDVAYVEI